MLSTPAYSAVTVFSDDFDDYNIREWARSGNKGSQAKVVNSPTRKGNYALRVTLDRKKDPVPFRTELQAKKTKLFLKRDYWTGFSIQLPANWKQDVHSDTLLQIHGLPDSGEKWRMPLMALAPEKGYWKLIIRWDARSKTPGTKPQGAKTFKLGSIQPGKWVDWVIHHKPSYSTGGLVEVWKNGKKVLSYKGPNAYNDKGGMVTKIGVYKPAWRPSARSWSRSVVSSREVYFDEFVIKENGSLSSVQP